MSVPISVPMSVVISVDSVVVGGAYSVAISVVAACMWMLEHPRQGVCVPDDLPHDYILEISKPYLGAFLSLPSDWNPLKHYSNVFDSFNRPQLDRSDPWQFKNFLITEGD